MIDLLLLTIGAFFAAMVSGAAGFGGALLLLPLLVAVTGPTQAVPLLTVAQLVGNFSRVGFGFASIHWQSVAWFLLGAIPASLAGALTFVRLPSAFATRAIGAAILAFVAWKVFGGVSLRVGPRILVIGGAATGFLSGVVGSAGPLGAAIFLSLGLPPTAYIASEAMTALVMHGVKMAIYQNFIEFDQTFWLVAIVMSCAMILGTWTAKRYIELMPRVRFERLVTLMLAGVAVYMLVRG